MFCMHIIVAKNPVESEANIDALESDLVARILAVDSRNQPGTSILLKVSIRAPVALLNHYNQTYPHSTATRAPT